MDDAHEPNNVSDASFPIGASPQDETYELAAPSPTAVDPNSSEIHWAHPIEAAQPVTVLPSDPLKLLNESRGQAWLDVLILFVLWAVLEIVSDTIIHHTVMWTLGIAGDTEAQKQQIEQSMLMPVITVRAVGFLVFIWLILRHRHLGWSAAGLKRAALGTDLAVGLGGLMIAYAAHFTFIGMLYMFFPGLTESLGKNAERLNELFPAGGVRKFIPFMFVVGFYEELVFRGFLMPRLRRGTGSWILAVLISTALFALLHAGNQMLVALIPIALLSLTMSILTIWRRSIVPAIVTHFLFDATQLIGLYWIYKDRMNP